LCGKTRYRLEASPTALGDCHCIDCRRASAAPFVTWGTVPRASLRLLAGELRVVPHAKRVRSFAVCCGTPLFFAEAGDSPTVDFTVCSLDDPAPFAPRKAIWTEDRLPWVVLNEALPVHRQSSGG
jgi:hypothetical protein